jgi:hypothetical protein
MNFSYKNSFLNIIQKTNELHEINNLIEEYDTEIKKLNDEKLNEEKLNKKNEDLNFSQDMTDYFLQTNL